MQQSIKLTYGHPICSEKLVWILAKIWICSKKIPLFHVHLYYMDVPSTLCVVNLASEAYILLLLFIDMVNIYMVQHDFELAALF